MLNHRKDQRSEEREKARGGNGVISFLHLVEGKGAVHKNIHLLAELTLPPGASIGPHSHSEDTEFFIILKGSGIINDNGTDKPISAGDVITTGNGETHSIENNGNIPLVLIAVIVKD